MRDARRIGQIPIFGACAKDTPRSNGSKEAYDILDQGSGVTVSREGCPYQNLPCASKLTPGLTSLQPSQLQRSRTDALLSVVLLCLLM
jgi:hypothetical protein